MLSRRRRLVHRLVVGAALTSALLVLGPVGPAGAVAPDPPKTCAPTDPDCRLTVGANDPGSQGSSGNGASNGGSGPCIAEGQYGPVEVPCYLDGVGAYVGGNCYLRLAPEKTDPPPAGAETPGAWYERNCFAPDDVWGFGFYEWIPAGAAPTLTPGQLARRALASISLLPADIHIAPNPAGSGLVGLPVWMWTTVNANTWGPISASDSDAGLTVSITAHAVSVAWSMGDGHTVICDNPGTPYEARFGFAHSPTCGHVYEIKSLARPGSVFPVTATTTWQVPWSGGGESGVITVLRQSQSTVRIGELEAVIE